MATSTNLPPDVSNEVVFHSYNGGFIVLSYFVSVVGCWTALELLHRRTGARGLYNWYLLLGAATSMGAVAIWSMHFIGNRAINMADGEADLQILYSPVFTAGSFFLPICAVAIAFYLFTITENVSIIGTLAGGFLSGMAICGMHYLGQGGISNYHAEYEIAYIVGSAAVAVVAATIALGVFFYFKSAWTNTVWKRMSCALLLAVAVSGMHWVATVGTAYRLKAIDSANVDGLGRRTTVVVVLCLAIGCCFTLIMFAVIGQRSRQRYRDRAQQVVLACATWDSDGRLLVTPEGFLPCRKITNIYIDKSFNDVFTVEHPVFAWIFRVSRCWEGVADLVPGMRNHLRASSHIEGSRRRSSAGSGSSNPNDSEDYAQIFKEHFCVAASDLATMFQEQLENLGVLFDEIMDTGTTRNSTKSRLLHPVTDTAKVEDIEASPVSIGRGQLLFTVRQASKDEAAQLQSTGFRFAPVHQIIDHLARSMQVTQGELRPRLEKMQNYPIQARMLEPGVHIACFALRPLTQGRGFDILVNKAARNLLPTVKLPIDRLARFHTDIISRFDNWKISQCLDYLSKPPPMSSATPDERLFFSQLHSALLSLTNQVGNTFTMDAKLTARPLRTQYTTTPATNGPSQAEIIAFRIMIDIHDSRLTNCLVEFTSSRFFLCQQHIYPGSPDHTIFARRAHQEFACFAQPKPTRSSSNAGPKSSRGLLTRMPSSPALGKWTHAKPKRASHHSADRGDSGSEKDLVVEAQPAPFGGIHVENEVSVDVTEARRGDRSPSVEMRNLGVFNEASVAPAERESFIDELMALTIGERRFQRTCQKT